MKAQLERFWKLLETNFPLGGPRRHLAELLGPGLVAQLEALKILRHQRVADAYPCPGPMGDHCPRAVIQLASGEYRAVCGNEPEDCSELELSAEDVSYLAVDPVALCEAVAHALRVRGGAKALSELRHVYRAGTFMPEPGIRHPVYLAVRCAERDYAEVFHALRSQQTSPAFAILVLTEDFVGDATVPQMRALGVPILPLDDVLSIENGQLTSRVDVLSYFEGLGRSSSAPQVVSPTLVAQALVGDGREPPSWHDLDERGYQELIAAAGEYEIFADERTHTAARTANGKREQRERVQASHFQILRACVEHRGLFDPTTDSGGGRAAKQTFVRARQAIDVKFRRPGDKEDWKLFKSRREEEAAHYEFAPEPGTRFALIFRPRS